MAEKELREVILTVHWDSMIDMTMRAILWSDSVILKDIAKRLNAATASSQEAQEVAKYWLGEYLTEEYFRGNDPYKSYTPKNIWVATDGAKREKLIREVLSYVKRTTH